MKSLFAGALLSLALAAAHVSSAQAAGVVVLELSGTIQPASLRYVERGLQRAADEGADLALLELNTEGGTLISLREMTRALTSSPVPVAVFVTPQGGRAASAGFFLLLAADVAAMSPGTNTGAAHPVTIGGEASTNADAPAAKKMVEDAAALARSLAEARGRPVTWAEKAVRDAQAYSAEEALEHGLIELVARDRTELIERLDGQVTQRMDGQARTLELSSARVTEVPPTLAERTLMVIAHPQIAFLLLMFGALGLLLEAMSPGGFVFGVFGAISLLLGFYAFSVLPVSWVGALLLLLGLGLLVAEAFVSSYGLLTVAGLGSFVLGSLLLIDTPIAELRIGVELAVPVALVLGGITVLLATRALRASRTGVRAGREALVGEEGRVTQAIQGDVHVESKHESNAESKPGLVEGRVFVHGESWIATAAVAVPKGAKVRVERVEGLRLRVSPVGSG